MLEIRHLWKRYDHTFAVRDLTMRVEEGDLFGFIGPNGAGKTTTIRIAATLLEPTEGTVLVDGHDVVKEPETVRQLIGFMPDFFGVYDDMKVWEYLDFFATAYRLPPRRRKRAIDDVLELTDLTGKRDAFVEELSRGMKQRLCLARTLLHDPKLLLLDEPASGLDPRARIELRELLKELRRMGKTILISSHILTELADFCNRVGIIEAGQLVAAGPVDLLLRQAGGLRSLDLRVVAGIEKAEALLSEFPEVVEMAMGVDQIHVEFNGPLERVADLLQTLLEGGVRIVAVQEKNNTLEEVFLRLTKGVVA